MKHSLIALTVLLASATAHATTGSSLKCGAFVQKFVETQNARNLDAFVALFDKNYVSFQPMGPAGSFTGNETVKIHWQGLFALGLKQTGAPDFKTGIDHCVEEKGLNGVTRVKLVQTWQGGFDANGENPCFSAPVYSDMAVKKGKALYAEIYFNPALINSLMACLPAQAE